MEDFEFYPMCEIWIDRAMSWQHHLEKDHTNAEIGATQPHNYHKAYMCPICYVRIRDALYSNSTWNAVIQSQRSRNVLQAVKKLPRRKRNGVLCVICRRVFDDFIEWSDHLCRHSDRAIRLYLDDLENASYVTPRLEPHFEEIFGKEASEEEVSEKEVIESDGRWEIIHPAEAGAGSPKVTVFEDI